MILRRKKIRVNFLINPFNGAIYLSPEDAALVEAGLLDPYELVENITVPSNPDHVTE